MHWRDIFPRIFSTHYRFSVVGEIGWILLIYFFFCGMNTRKITLYIIRMYHIYMNSFNSFNNTGVRV